MGTSIYCSQMFGARRYNMVKTGILTSIFVFVPFSLLLSVLSVYFSDIFLHVLNVPENSMLITAQYLKIYLAGIPFMFLYNISNGILTSVGNSKTPLLALILSTVINVILDIILVRKIPLGIQGLALATFISQIVSAVSSFFAVIILYRKMSLSKDGDKRSISLLVLVDILKISIPSMIQHVFMSMGQMFMQNVINSYGFIVMAGYTIAFRINGIVINSLMALSNALSGFIAQNKGAEKYTRVWLGYKNCIIISYIFSAAIIIILFMNGEMIISSFVYDTQYKMSIVDAGMGFIRIVVPFYLVVCLKIVSDGALRGIGAMIPFMTATLSDVVIRICFGNIFSKLWGIQGVWAIWPLAWLVGTIISFGAYIYKSKMLLKL